MRRMQKIPRRGQNLRQTQTLEICSPGIIRQHLLPKRHSLHTLLASQKITQLRYYRDRRLLTHLTQQLASLRIESQNSGIRRAGCIEGCRIILRKTKQNEKQQPLQTAIRIALAFHPVQQSTI